MQCPWCRQWIMVFSGSSAVRSPARPAGETAQDVLQLEGFPVTKRVDVEVRPTSALDGSRNRVEDDGAGEVMSVDAPAVLSDDDSDKSSEISNGNIQSCESSNDGTTPMEWTTEIL